MEVNNTFFKITKWIWRKTCRDSHWTWVFSPNQLANNIYVCFEIAVDPCDLIGFQQCHLFTNRTIFCSKLHLFFLVKEKSSVTKTNPLIRFRGLFKVGDMSTCGNFRFPVRFSRKSLTKRRYLFKMLQILLMEVIWTY